MPGGDKRRRHWPPGDEALIIQLTGEINSVSLDRLTRVLLSGSAGDTVYLFINSGGGECDAGFSIVSLLRLQQRAGRRIVTVNYGDVSSMAFPIFVQGDERYATDGATWMLHEIQDHFETGDTQSTTESEFNAELNKKLWEKYLNCLTEGFNQRRFGPAAVKKKIAAAVKKEWHPTLSELLDVGVVTAEGLPDVRQGGEWIVVDGDASGQEEG